MKKPKYVYHGSGKELKGDKLVPKKAADLERNSDNCLKGIYASGTREESIAMGIMSCKGVGSSSLRIKNGKMDAIIFKGWPKQDYFYLYTLKSETFENRPKGSQQYVSLKAVKPVKIERLPVKKYVGLVRKPSEKEKKEWFGRYGIK